MRINDVYDSINPLHSRFLEFCLTQGLETAYELTFFNYFDLERNGYKIEEIINLQTVLFDLLQSRTKDLASIKTRKQLKQLFESSVVIDVEPPAMKIKVDEGQKFQPVSNSVVSKQVVVNAHKIVSDFTALKKDFKFNDDIHIAKISKHIPGYSRENYNSSKLYTIAEYQYMSNEKLSELFKEVTVNEYEDYIDFLRFITSLFAIVNTDNHYDVVNQVISQDLANQCYICDIERYKDFKIVSKNIKLYEALPAQLRFDLLYELEFNNG